MAKTFSKEALELITKAAQKATEELINQNCEVSYHGDNYVGIDTGDPSIRATIYQDGSLGITINQNEKTAESRKDAFRVNKSACLKEEIAHLDESKKKLQIQLEALTKKEEQS
jgi:hypothetical protein